MVAETAEELSWWEAEGPTRDAAGAKNWTNMGQSDSATFARARCAADPEFRKLDGSSKSKPLWKAVYVECRKNDPTFFNDHVKDLTWPMVRTKLSDRYD